MKPYALLLSTVATLSLSGAAFAADKTTYESKTSVESDSKGNYNKENKTQSTNASGTTTEKEKVEVDVHSNGDVDNTVKTEKTIDPKGLMNTGADQAGYHGADHRAHSDHKASASAAP